VVEIVDNETRALVLEDQSQLPVPEIREVGDPRVDRVLGHRDIQSLARRSPGWDLRERGLGFSAGG
jgi:hypothetical protein